MIYLEVHAAEGYSISDKLLLRVSKGQLAIINTVGDEVQGVLRSGGLIKSTFRYRARIRSGGVGEQLSCNK